MLNHFKVNTCLTNYIDIDTPNKLFGSTEGNTAANYLLFQANHFGRQQLGAFISSITFQLYICIFHFHGFKFTLVTLNSIKKANHIPQITIILKATDSSSHLITKIDGKKKERVFHV